MITLLAESKNMGMPKGIMAAPMGADEPCFRKDASDIAEVFSSMPVEEIAERYEVSVALAAKAKRLFYEFHNPQLSAPALMAFTGEVFMGLDICSLGESDLEFAYRKVGIISSLYGWLQASDLINPYRFDYYVENPMTCERMHDYWKPRVTAALLRVLSERGEKEVLNLLPEAAARCIDWNLVRQVADVSKVSFKTIDDSGKLKTPYSWRVKDLRGKLLREVLIHKIDSIADVVYIQTPFLSLEEKSDDIFSPTFLCL